MNRPAKICIIRLSAIGDVCNCIPTLRALQKEWPEAKVTWIVGKIEHSIVRDIEGVSFIVFDKTRFLREIFRLYNLLKGQEFDVLLQMQASLRSSFLSLAVRAVRKIGFDEGRSKDFQTFFSNERIDSDERVHMVDTFLDFARKAGVRYAPPEWRLATNRMKTELDGLSLRLPERFYIVSPCSSKPIRNWGAERYAAVVQAIWKKYGIICLITGGNSRLELEYGEIIQQDCVKGVINLAGKTTLRQLMALLEQAVYVIAPDSGPAHMAAAVGTPVIGLYANTNPDRARSYDSRELVVNRYPQALEKYYNKSANEAPWGTRVRVAGVMNLITVDDVMEKVDRVVNLLE